ncbi:hypothetical protein SAMN02745194_04006 [Roseomonas rosea]|uniref:Lipoprotein n=1 Tax=Muricoccus roseus TaxID=198092 RepID=A0A1M6P648_9PROT|nr:hypothetical protein [Roseomonas rosea]SHK03469.1 hypothetical protein SAMN02745194_04006 [Roseomonas rosea]
MRRTPLRAFIPALALASLAACSPDPPPAMMGEIPLRAPTLPPAIVLVSLPGVAPVPRVLSAELSRGGEAVCAPLVGTRLEPVADSTFRLMLNPPGFAVTRETVFRRTVDAPFGGPELAMDGANNGRCDYVFRTASAG